MPGGGEYFQLSEETYDWLRESSVKAVNRAVDVRELVAEPDPGDVEAAPDGQGSGE